MHSVGSSGFCKREKLRIHCSVETRRGNQAAHSYRQRACSPDPPDNAKDYTASLDRHKKQTGSRKAVALHRRETEFPRCGCRRKRDPDRNENRLACNSDRMSNDRPPDPSASERRFPGAIRLPTLPRFPGESSGGRSSFRCHCRTDRLVPVIHFVTRSDKTITPTEPVNILRAFQSRSSRRAVAAVVCKQRLNPGPP